MKFHLKKYLTRDEFQMKLGKFLRNFPSNKIRKKNGNEKKMKTEGNHLNAFYFVSRIIKSFQNYIIIQEINEVDTRYLRVRKKMMMKSRERKR